MIQHSISVLSTITAKFTTQPSPHSAFIAKITLECLPMKQSEARFMTGLSRWPPDSPVRGTFGGGCTHGRGTNRTGTTSSCPRVVRTGPFRARVKGEGAFPTFCVQALPNSEKTSRDGFRQDRSGDYKLSERGGLPGSRQGVIITGDITGLIRGPC